MWKILLVGLVNPTLESDLEDDDPGLGGQSRGWALTPRWRYASAIADVIGRHLNLPVVSIAPEDAGEHFTWLAHFLVVGSPASSALTRELLNWRPKQRGLIDDLDEGHYFHD